MLICYFITRKGNSATFLLKKEALPGWNFAQSVFAEVDSGDISRDGCIPNVIRYADGSLVTTAKYRRRMKVRPLPQPGVEEGGGVLVGILGEGVPPGSQNPDPISDQKMSFYTPVFRPDLSNPYPFSGL